MSLTLFSDIVTPSVGSTAPVRPRFGAPLGIAAVICALFTAPAFASWDTRNTASGRSIEGYSSEVSVLPGEAVHLHVSTSPAQSYRIVLYRIGWQDSGDPLPLACTPSCTGSASGADQPVPAPDPSTGKLDAGWPVTDTFQVPSSWTSGYYVAKLLLTSGPEAGKGRLVPFIVRAPPGRKSAILVQSSVNTWQAYNNWGGKSLYASRSTDGVAANRVSFNRPYAIPYTGGGQSPFDWEIHLARFLESEGYDVSYTTDVDVHRDPSTLLGHRLVISNGHDEYWSKEQRDGFEAARGAGVNLGFFGADQGVWQVRYEDAERTVVGYKSPNDPENDPARKTVQFRQLTPPRPECELEGVGYEHGSTANGGLDYTIAGDSLRQPG